MAKWNLGLSSRAHKQADDEVRKNLPQGVKLVRTLRGHTGFIGRIAWSPDGRLLASPSQDNTIRLWDAATGECLRTLNGHADAVYSVAFDPTNDTLISGSKDCTAKLWQVASGRLLHTFKGHPKTVFTVAFDPAGLRIASGSTDGMIKLWEVVNGQLLHTLEGDASKIVHSVAFDSTGRHVASGIEDGTIKLWEAASGRLLRTLEGHKGNVESVDFDHAGALVLSGSFDRTIKVWDYNKGDLVRTLEGHTDEVTCAAFSRDDRLIASRSCRADGSVRLWAAEAGSHLVTIRGWATGCWPPSLAFHPHRPLLATVGSDPGTPEGDKDRDHVIHLYELDFDFLLGQPAKPSVSYTSAKVVLVGDSGVGKTGLGWRLAHGEFKEHASTHGQQFWLLEQLGKKRADRTECEAVLWDLAGQPDYRLIHALFLDDADLALVLFDPTRNDDPLAGVEFWLKQLKVGHAAGGGPPTVLIAARSDRGTPRLTQEELDAFCRQRGITAYQPTSAMRGEGIDALVERMKGLIPWDAKPATVTTETFKRIKDYVLGLKEAVDHEKLILTPEELRERLQATDSAWEFTDAEMLTAVGHLANHGYVTRLKTSQGEPRLLLAPELLNNLAASFVLEARREEKGLGSLKEQKLLAGGYPFPELAGVTEAERVILLDSAAVLFLEHNVCFRETDLLGATYLVFPELINLKRPLDEDGPPVEDGVAYTASGAVENVYASLVVLMGYTQTFTRTNQWRNHARYEVGRGQVCGFRLEAERAGELEFVLYFGTDTPVPVRMLFQSLFENFLARRNLTVRRFEPVACKNGHPLNRAVVRQRSMVGADFAFCSECGEKTALPKADQPIQLTKQQAAEVEADRRAADERSRFEQVLFRLKTYVTERKLAVPECFISYAWGNTDHELWVERRLATDMLKAGVRVVLDRWENARIGANVPRFVERAGECDRVIVVGTHSYRTKYDNEEPMRGFVLAAEGDLIGERMIGSEAKKETVLPVLLEGTKETAFPRLLHPRVYADFRKAEAYAPTMLDLLLTLFAITPQEPVAIELRKSLGGAE
ncbi:MAG: TIR domain-containing protein [Chthoniobacter sp.]|uniref:WD40 domain-containing protein n=1 Tax=Chthoniobacter sp. TaxID=2510640 RepID=UPI0032A92810